MKNHLFGKIAIPLNNPKYTRSNIFRQWTTGGNSPVAVVWLAFSAESEYVLGARVPYKSDFKYISSVPGLSL